MTTSPTASSSTATHLDGSAAAPAAAGKSSSSSSSNSGKQRKRVLIVGAGCSGMAAAYSLSLSPDQFDVTVYDKSPSVGGSATSYQLPVRGTDVRTDQEVPYPYGAEYINDGVQGASPVFHNTFKMFEHVLGFKATEVGMQISFGKGKDSFWSNVFPSELVDHFSDDIKKFGRVLQTIKRFEVFFAVIPVSRMLSMFRFSPSFGERMVYPLVALFFGTGNETKHISSAILERVFLDPSMRLFEFSEDSLLASVPTMMAFPELARVYGSWKNTVEQHGNVRVETQREVTALYRGGKRARQAGGNILALSRRVDSEGKPIEGKEAAEDREEAFDELILAADADSCLKILQAGNGASWREKKVLGNVLYKWDTTITHSDYAYMQKYYQMTYDDTYNAERQDEESRKAFAFAKENWRPLYLIHMYEHDPAAIEMSFDLTHYQPQFQGKPPTGEGSKTSPADAPPTQRQGAPTDRNLADGNTPTELAERRKQLAAASSASGTGTSGAAEPPVEQHVYQTIYLDKDMRQHWTDGDVDPDKIILQKWWKQQSHRWQLYAFTVPWMWTINGKNHTNYAGGWSLVNMHEVGICAGFGAAYALGGKYPFSEDKECKRLMGLLYALQHMGRLRKEDREGFFM